MENKRNFELLVHWPIKDPDSTPGENKTFGLHGAQLISHKQVRTIKLTADSDAFRINRISALPKKCRIPNP